MRFIKNKKAKEPDTLKYHLHKKLSGTEPARPTKRVHASEMMKTGMYCADHEFCPREFALLDTLKTTRPDEYVSTSSRSTWNHGNMYANWIVHLFADMGKAVGDWKCQYCESEYKLQKRPRKCKECQHIKFKYEELRFLSQESGISCGVDFLFVQADDTLKPVELKTIKEDEFKLLAGPLAEHKWRTNLYLRIIEDSEGEFKECIDTSSGIVLYSAKAGWGAKDPDLDKLGFPEDVFSPFKEFLITRDDKQTQVKWEHARRLKEFRSGSKGMPLGICSSQWCKRAEGCSVVKECFSGKYKGST